MRIDPVSLRLFLSVAELGTIAGAVDREHIAASAISKRISDLEDALATDLFARTNKGLELTPSGVEFQNLAREILNSLETCTRTCGVMRAVRVAWSGSTRTFR